MGLSNKFCDVEPYFHFVGKIDEKYKISMSLCKRKDNKIIGEYFYWKQNKKIKLEGQINTGSQKIFLNEWVENSKTGSFDLEWDDFLYSTEGFWYAPSNEKKLSVKLINVYDFEDREYYR